MECKNCHHEINENQHFCPNCGQKNIPHLNLKYLLEEFLENYIYIESKLFKTLKNLVFKPGRLSKEFIEGKRVSFVAPIRLYITFSVLFFFIIALGNFIDENTHEKEVSKGIVTFSYKDKKVDVSAEKYNELKEKGEFVTFMKDSIGAENAFERYIVEKTIIAQNSGDSFKETLLNQLSIFLILFIPFISLFYKWSFARNKYNYIKHLVFNLHFNSFIILLLTFDKLLLFFINDDSGLGLIITIVISLLYVLIYWFFSLKKFYERKAWVVLYKMIFLLIGYIISATLFFLLLVLMSLVITH